MRAKPVGEAVRLFITANQSPQRMTMEKTILMN
jgi:hypothetical protein